MDMQIILFIQWGSEGWRGRNGKTGAMRESLRQF